MLSAIIELILFHFTTYIFHSLLVIALTIIFIIIIKKTRQRFKAKKTLGFIILCYSLVFWNASILSSMGTGSFVGSNYVITNHHVANKSCRKITVQDANIIYEAKFLGGYKKDDIDLSFLKVSGATKENFLAINLENLKHGEQLYFPDYYKNNPGYFSVSTGMVNLTKQNVSDNNLALSSKNVRPGNSGSPIVNSNGELVGVLWGGDLKGHFIHAHGVGSNGFFNDMEVVVNLAKELDITLHQAPKRKYYKGNISDFINHVSVTVTCHRL